MNTGNSADGARMARLWILIAVIYLLAGTIFGVVMGMTETLQYAPVHAHINLLGWATLALTGIIYKLYPAAAASRLGKAHFWSYNLTLPVLMVVLYLFFGGKVSLAPVMGILSIIVVLSLVVFATNLFLNTKE